MLILWFMVNSGMPMLGPQLSEIELYVQFIYLSIYLFIASMEKQGGE